ncbi:MAG: ROK family protein [Clostridia bacterium]|nr:ROK family protein [Clostridia bacterium]MBQ9041107.1 ROK family protein [Clostridia bacterium]
MLYIGIDVGGMSIKAGLVDEEGNILFKHSCPTGVERGYVAVIRDIAQLGLATVEKAGRRMDEVKAIGIGIPGIMDQRTGIIPFCTNLAWHDVPIIEEMKQYTDLPVYVDNDATVAGLAESVKGVSAGTQNSVFITLGTGVGGGVVLNGKVFSGAHGVATEIGHMVTVAGGLPCTCGKRGCWERYASATALIRAGRVLCAEKPSCTLMKHVDGDIRTITAKDVIDLAMAGDADCVKIFDDYIYHLVVGLTNLINVYDPEVIVLGGGVSHCGDFLLNAVRSLLPKYVFFKSMPYARVELARLTNDAGIIGAAMLGR